MAIILVTYDLKQPGRNYTPVHDYLKTFSYCKGLESVWLLDTQVSCSTIRDGLQANIDSNDEVFVTRLYPREWASWRYYCAEWLQDPVRSW
jgi:hypothetical protein